MEEVAAVVLSNWGFLDGLATGFIMGLIMR